MKKLKNAKPAISRWKNFLKINIFIPIRKKTHNSVTPEKKFTSGE